MLFQHPFGTNTTRSDSEGHPFVRTIVRHPPNSCGCLKTCQLLFGSETLDYYLLSVFQSLADTNAFKPINCSSAKKPSTTVYLRDLNAGRYRRLKAYQRPFKRKAAQPLTPPGAQTLAATGTFKPVNYPRTTTGILPIWSRNATGTDTIRTCVKVLIEFKMSGAIPE
ncbi:hypothetical protein EG329_005863 [Mollisiaceae sp. DMI_Dod_QoI]|nr:hypothetical protein EG329_005863 [Helotiales sp. DMI_Dod_QoI]